MEENFQTPKRNIPRDLFLHLLAIVTLYWSAISFTTLLWQNINYYLPDILNNYYYQDINGIVRFAVSSLIIVFPVFILISWYLNKIYTKEVIVRESKIRKWLIYLTLFIASLVIIADLISIINMLLGGEITSRFILKAISIILVAGVIFGYYLDDVRRDIPAKMGKYFAWITSILVLAAIISAFFIVGTPQTARLMQFDYQKITDLSGIQYQIVTYYQKKGVLPNSLSDLNDPISNYMIPVDPQTKSSYEYSVKKPSDLAFELCANFNKSGNGQTYGATVPMPAGSVGQNWQHGVGRVCFERTIDKQLYPLLNKTK